MNNYPRDTGKGLDQQSSTTMQLLPPFVFALVLFSTIGVSRALDCRNGNGTSGVAYTITVNPLVQPGKGVFNTIQAAIDSIPPNNDQWVKVLISPGIYKEKVQIPMDRQCLFLEGKSSRTTVISYGDHGQTDVSATFTSNPDNVIFKGITFENSFARAAALEFNNGNVVDGQLGWALAARIYGDKSAFYDCGFTGFQDTLWDVGGRHYFKTCYFEGGVDFIWGAGQSVYEEFLINVTMGPFLTQGLVGYVTAQGRDSPDDTSGFVFRRGFVKGTGRALLGRAYRAYSRVIFQETEFDGIVSPEGWSAWENVGHEANLTYAEVDCKGPGSEKSKRVPWMKQLSRSELDQFSTSSFINQDGWLDRLPL